MHEFGIEVELEDAVNRAAEILRRNRTGQADEMREPFPGDLIGHAQLIAHLSVDPQTVVLAIKELPVEIG